MQIRPKIRLLLCTTKKGKQEKCASPVGRDTLRVPMSLFRAMSSTTDIYKNSKNTHFITKKATDQGNNLFRRHDIDVTNNRGVVNQQGHCDISADIARFCNQTEKINAESSIKNRISGLGNRLSCNQFITRQRKVLEIVQMSQNALNNMITLRKLTELIGKLTSTIQAILPAKFQIRFLQQKQIKVLRESLAY